MTTTKNNKTWLMNTDIFQSVSPITLFCTLFWLFGLKDPNCFGEKFPILYLKSELSNFRGMGFIEGTGKFSFKCPQRQIKLATYDIIT